MDKTITLLMIFILIPVVSADFDWWQLMSVVNPFTGTGDIVRSINQTGNEWEFDNITARDRVNFGDSDHFITKDYEFVDTIASASIDTVHTEVLPQGTIVTCTIYAPNNNLTDLRLIECRQVGRNNSMSVVGNSQFAIRNDICSLDRFNNGTHCNMTAVSDYTILCDEFNHTANDKHPCQYFADTAGRGGPMTGTMGDGEFWRTVNIMEGIRASEMADFIDTDVDILNGSFHSQIPVTCNLGTPIGQERKLVNEGFLGNLGVFDNLQVDSGDWHSKPDARCDSIECANANGLSQTGNLIMQANFSTLNFNQTGVSFVYSLTKIIAANSFSVTINNNSGSGDITLLTDSTDDVLLSSQYFAFPDGFDNVTKVSLNFICDVTKSDRLCFVDTVIVNGSSTADTTFNETRIASETCFDTGERDSNGRCEFGEYWEPCNRTLVIRGNVTEVNIIVETETITGELILDSESISNWDNLINFVQGIWNVSGNDIFYNKGKVNASQGIITPNITSPDGTIEMDNISTSMIETDHIDEKTGGHNVVFDNNVDMSGNDFKVDGNNDIVISTGQINTYGNLIGIIPNFDVDLTATVVFDYTTKSVFPNSDTGMSLGKRIKRWKDLDLSGEIDLGTNTIADENMTGDWDYNGGDLTNIGTIEVTNEIKGSYMNLTSTTKHTRIGGDTITLATNDLADRLVVTKQVTSGGTVALRAVNEFETSSDNAGTVFGGNIFCNHNGSGDLTSTNLGGGCIGNRVAARLYSSGNIATGGGMDARAQIVSGATGNFTDDAYGYTSLSCGTQAGTYCNRYQGFWAMDTNADNGEFFEQSGFRVDDLALADKNYGFWANSNSIGLTLGTAKNSTIYNDGNNLILHSGDSDVHIMNDTGWGTIVYGNAVEMSKVADMTNGESALDKLDNIADWRDSEGEINHLEHFAYTQVEVIDKSRPENETRTAYIEDENTGNIIGSYEYNVTIYPHTKLVDGLNTGERDSEQEKMIYELNQENQMLKDRLTVIEAMLNISDISIPEESETDLYRCSYKEDRECLGGLSAPNKETGFQTRCYNYLKLGWSTCNTGWVKI